MHNYLYSLDSTHKRMTYLKFRDFMIFSYFKLGTNDVTNTTKTLSLSINHHFPKRIPDKRRICFRFCFLYERDKVNKFACDICVDEKERLVGLCVQNECFKKCHQEKL